ncbi:MAG: hypothetical protein NW226_17600 [Microscillaceae bacterium]|nr:hypothetical protein [Microscillaceae bacterium]
MNEIVFRGKAIDYNPRIGASAYHLHSTNYLIDYIDRGLIDTQVVNMDDAIELSINSIRKARSLHGSSQDEYDKKYKPRQRGKTFVQRNKDVFEKLKKTMNEVKNKRL